MSGSKCGGLVLYLPFPQTFCSLGEASVQPKGRGLWRAEFSLLQSSSSLLFLVAEHLRQYFENSLFTGHLLCVRHLLCVGHLLCVRHFTCIAWPKILEIVLNPLLLTPPSN